MTADEMGTSLDSEVGLMLARNWEMTRLVLCLDLKIPNHKN